jgi:thiamine-phosphate pyrophosphorylase
MDKNYLKLCLVTHAKDIPLLQYKQFILQVIAGGVTSIQLREKFKNTTELYQIARELKILLHPIKIPLIINDHVELAKEINADGVHLGQTDFSPHDARKMLGPSKIIGLSIETLDQLKIANQLNCINYVAASAIFPSTTKTNCKTIWGLEGLRDFTQQSKHPVIAIGGINENNVKQVIKHGAAGVAVIHALHSHSNPRDAAINLITQINQSWNKHV